MRIWNSFPMLRVIPPFVLGVVGTSFALEFMVIPANSIILAYAGLTLVMFIGLLWAGISKKSGAFGLWMWGAMMLIGAGLTGSISSNLYSDSLASSEPEGVQTYLAEIVEQPQVKEKTVKIIAELSDNSISRHGKVLLYFKNDSSSCGLKYGQVLAVSTKLSRVENLGNPNEFNYKRYLRFHGIEFRGYVDEGGFEVLSNAKPSVMGWLYDIRSKLITKLEEAQLGEKELSVASALILGYRADLDKELMSAYAGAGATHVLAVSGLHVGIVYVILNTLLKFMDKRRSTKLLKTALLIILLFGYAGLTGLSASVFRAATMFSFVAVGKALKRDTNIFNTLAASAFVLIAFDPMIIMQVGFQLSYAAVIGIVLIQPRLFNLIAFNNRFLDWAWSITCVSVAAQIATFPLGLLYFHQFPNLFLVSNLLVIPAAAGILYLGFCLFLFSFWQPTLFFFGFLLDTLIGTLNRVVVWIEQVPYSVLSGIDISTFETLVIYVMISTILVFIIQKSRYALYAGLVLMMLFTGLQIIEVYQQQNQHLITVYNVRKQTAIALVNGTEVTFLSSKALYENEQAMLFHIKHHWWRLGVDKVNFIEMNDRVFNRELEWYNSKFAVLSIPKVGWEESVILEDGGLDFIVVDDLPRNSLHTLIETKTQKILLSSSLTPHKSEDLTSLLSENTQPELRQVSENAIVLEL